MKTAPARVLAALSLCAVLLAPSPAAAFELIAWPLSAARLWHTFLPGQPPRPLPPPQNHPMPRPLPSPRPGPAPQPITEGTPLELSDYTVDVVIEDQAARQNWRVVFKNPTASRLEGVLLIPLPADSVLSGFSMTVGGKKVSGELLEADKASSIYQSIVSQMRDPGLLELVGERLYRVRVFPIEPHASIEAHLELSQVLPKNNGLYSLNVPLRAAKLGADPEGKSSARVTLNATKPLRTLYSPLSSARIERRGDRQATIAYTEGIEPRKDFSVFYSLEEGPLSAGMLTYHEAGEDGTFLLSLTPPLESAASSALAKDMVFIVDRSGSMGEDGKMDQARSALAYCLKRLSPQDRFGIVDFATDFSAFESRLMPATPENRERALRYVERLDAAGGTNIEAGLAEGLKLLASPKEGSVPMVFFLTDGLPTVGANDVNVLLKRASDINVRIKARVFSFGVGSDVNTLLLDKLAALNRGARDYVASGEKIEDKVSTLYQKIAKPALSDLRLEWEGVDIFDVYPRPLSELFHGSSLLLTGRFKNPGQGKLILTGQRSGRSVRHEFPIVLAARARGTEFLPRLWAGQKVAHELDALRLTSGPIDPEAVASIVKLAKRYGIVTPYTSFLVTEEGKDFSRAQSAAVRGVREMNREAASSGFSGGAARAKTAQFASNMLGGMASAASSYGMAEAEQATRAELGLKGEAAADMRSVAGKTFYKRGDTWVDAELELGVNHGTPVKISALSPSYFELLKRHPGLRSYLALGSRVSLLYQGIVYEIE